MKSPDFRDVDGSDPAAAVAFLDLTERVGGRDKRRNVELLGVLPGDVVLDVGCGVGLQSAALARLAGPSGRVVACDMSRAMLAEARSRHRAATLMFGRFDVCALPVGDGRFDRVHVQRVLHCLPDPGRAMAEIVRVTRPCGRVMVAEPDWGSVTIAGGSAELTGRIIDHALPDEHPTRIGCRLDRFAAAHGAEVELCEARHTVLTDFATAHDLLGLTGFAFRAMRRGVVDRADATAWLRSLVDASRRGALTCSISGQVVVARSRGG